MFNFVTNSTQKNSVSTGGGTDRSNAKIRCK